MLQAKSRPKNISPISSRRKGFPAGNRLRVEDWFPGRTEKYLGVHRLSSMVSRTPGGWEKFLSLPGEVSYGHAPNGREDR
jgi:hypothetical protein